MYWKKIAIFSFQKLNEGQNSVFFVLKHSTVEAAYCDHFGTERKLWHKPNDNIIQTTFSIFREWDLLKPPQTNYIIWLMTLSVIP